MFNAFLDAAPDAMVVVDADGLIRMANAQAHRLFDYPDDALLGLGIEALIPENARRAHEAHRARYMASPRVRPMGGAGQALTGRRRDGTEFPVEIALSPLDIERTPRFLASIRDISDTQRARQALVRAHYDAVVARIGQLALESPDEEQVTDTLPGLLAATLKVDAVAVVLMHGGRGDVRLSVSSGVRGVLADPVHWSAAIAGDGPTARALAQGEPLVVADFSAGHATDRDTGFADEGMHSGALIPLFDLHRPMGLLVALSRHRRRFDHDALHLLRSAANLMAALVQRRRSEEQLAHSQRLDAVGQLTGGIAHDFNNLLTVVSGNLQLLELDPDTHAGAAPVIDSALRAVQRGAELTAKLLAFARRQRLSPRAHDPAPLLRDLGPMLQRTLGPRIEVQIDCAAGLPAVYVDAGQLETALINLAINARDAMPRGGRIAIAAHAHAVVPGTGSQELQPGRYVAFSVADTGLGMSADVLARAFDPFFTTKPAGQGSGLGLSMVYGFVKQSGGHLTADSRLGYGTRIELILPAAQDAAVAGAEAVQQTPAGGHERVLVVEDEAAVREIAAAFLQSLGYRVRAVANADEALAALEDDADGFALLFSDVVLGQGMSGVGLAQAVQALRPELPVLLTSGYERIALPDSDAGIDRHALLRKPYRREDLALAVRQAIDGTTGASAP